MKGQPVTKPFSIADFDPHQINPLASELLISVVPDDTYGQCIQVKTARRRGEPHSASFDLPTRHARDLAQYILDRCNEIEQGATP